MATLEDGTRAYKQATDGNSSSRVTLRQIYGDRYRLSATSGLLTTIAAGTATAGHVFAFRWINTTRLCLVKRLYVKFRTIAGFTAAQEFGHDVFRLTGYSASHTSGTGFTLTAPNLKKRPGTGADATLTGSDLDARISTTTALTAGTHTLDTQQWMADQFAELAAGATVFKGQHESLFESTDHIPPLELLANEGIIVRNGLVAMGAGGTSRVTVEMDFDIPESTIGAATKDW